MDKEQMDKEQAIEIIERHIDNNIASGSLVEQALRMAIEALKQPEIVHCKDCGYFHEIYYIVGYCSRKGMHKYIYHFCGDAERRTDETD